MLREALLLGTGYKKGTGLRATDPVQLGTVKQLPSFNCRCLQNIQVVYMWIGVCYTQTHANM